MLAILAGFLFAESLVWLCLLGYSRLFEQHGVSGRLLRILGVLVLLAGCVWLAVTATATGAIGLPPVVLYLVAHIAWATERVIMLWRFRRERSTG